MHRQILKHIDVHVPVTRVWNAISHHHEFSEWFGVKLDAPFAVGQIMRGPLTHKGHEHMMLEAKVVKLEPEHHFSFSWHPAAIDPKVDYSNERPTLVEFKVEKIPDGARLTLKETGFDKMPVVRRDVALQMNEQGWSEVLHRLEGYLSKN